MEIRLSKNKIKDNSGIPEKVEINSKISKQLKYYSKNRSKINSSRRNKYKNKQKNVYKYKKPRPSKTSFYFSNIRKQIEQYNDNKPVLSLNSLVSLAYDKLIPEDQYTYSSSTVDTRNIALPEITAKVLLNGELFYSDLKRDFENLSYKQLQRNLQLLVKLKWIVRWGKYDWTRYYPNPFLLSLFKSKNTYASLCMFTKFGIDFFDLLNIPLLNAIDQKVTLAETKFSAYSRESQWIKAFFEGQVRIKLHTASKIYETIMPVNLHGANKREGKTNNPYGFPHHTIPLNWRLFDILSSREYHNGNTYIHFDNSFKIIKYEASKNSWGYNNYITFKKPFEKLLENKKNGWSTKTCQYVEVSDFDILQRLFTERFVNNKRRNELLDALDVTYTPKKHVSKDKEGKTKAPTKPHVA